MSITPSHRASFERLCNDAFGLEQHDQHRLQSGTTSAANHAGTAQQASVSQPRTATHQIDGVNYQSAEEVNIHQHLYGLFQKHITGENRDKFIALISERTKELHAMNETPASMDAVFSKGTHLNRLYSIANSTARAFPFAVASVSFDKFPALSAFAKTPAEVGLHAGIQASIADTVGIEMIRRATSNTHWFTAEEQQLEPSVSQAMQAKKPSDWQVSKEAAAAIQTYTLGNTLRLVGNPLDTQFTGAKAASNFDTWFTGARGMAAGGMMGAIMNEVNSNKGRIGPEYMLARTDWKEQYHALKETNPYTSPVTGAAKRLAKLPVDLITDTPKALAAAFTAGSIAKTAVIGGGFSGVISARSAVSHAMSSHGYSAAAASAMNYLTNVFTAAPMFAAAPIAEIMGGPVADKAVHMLQEKLPGALNSAADWAANQVRQTLGRQGSSLNDAERSV